MAEGMHLCGGSTAPTHVRAFVFAARSKWSVASTLVDGCDLDKSLAKDSRIIFMAVEDLFIEHCPLLACNLLSRVMSALKKVKARKTCRSHILMDWLYNYTDPVIDIITNLDLLQRKTHSRLTALALFA